MREQLINNISTDIVRLNREIQKNQEEVTFLEKDLVVLRKEYAKMVYYAYKNHNTYNNLLLVLSSEDLFQAFKRLRYLQQYGDYRKKQAEMIIRTKESLSKLILQLNTQIAEKQALLTQNEAEKLSLASEKSEKNTLITQLKSKEKDLIKQKKAKEAAISELNRAIQKIVQEEIRKQEEKRRKKREEEKLKNKNNNKPNNAVPAKTITSYELTPDEQLISNNFTGNMGKLPWPSESGIITSSFGTHPHPVYPEIEVNNTGVDISTPKGSVARAVFSGKVSGVVNIVGINAVIIRHGDYLTVYSNLSAVYVKKDQEVKTKQALGVIATDNSDGRTELHFEVRKGSSLLNPSSWISRK
ncbi:MAG: peptidoglycan DD-metalloendopeptidase family protein [Bacteroidota bacterium]